jgi:hypothetical protein
MTFYKSYLISKIKYQNIVLPLVENFFLNVHLIKSGIELSIYGKYIFDFQQM